MDTWVSPVPASVAPAHVGEASPNPGLDARSRARAVAEPSVRVVGGKARGGQRFDADATDPSTTFPLGALLDARYQILRFVGRGGMGEVYEAYDQLMDRHVALKTILRSVPDRSRAARRFKAEVRNAQRVAHPHVCRIHDLHEHHEPGSEAALPFFTMELIDGERLAQRLLGAALPLDDARQIALQLLDGLAAAHARGVLHLDFKSDNVLLRRGASPPDAAIMDFGLSRVLGDSGGLLTSDRRQFAGTLPYMSIEQLECRESLGPASDVYAFGVVLYEMLTGGLPFEGDTLGTLLTKQLKERPEPPSRRVPGLSPAIDRFVLRCLDREPRERFSDAGAALAALSAIRTWTRAGAPWTGWRIAWPAATLLVAGSVLLSSRKPQPPAPATEGALTHVTAPLAPEPALPLPEPALPLPEPALVSAATTSPSPLVATLPAATSESLAAETAPPGGLATSAGSVRPAAPRRVDETPAAGGARDPLGATPAPESESPPHGESAPSAADTAIGAERSSVTSAASWTPTRVPRRLTSGPITALAALPAQAVPAEAVSPVETVGAEPAAPPDPQNRPR